jgi:argonaute-like protein implicated in RNA metabolism and viral defense
MKAPFPARPQSEVNDCMSEIIIDASELKGEGSEVLQALETFLKDKTSADVKTEGKKLTVKGEGEAVNKKYLRVLLKKFLHKKELKESFRIISDEDENTLKVKERKVFEEE